MFAKLVDNTKSIKKWSEKSNCRKKSIEAKSRFFFCLLSIIVLTTHLIENWCVIRISGFFFFCLPVLTFVLQEGLFMNLINSSRLLLKF
jgi:hypothetical protein